MEPENTYTLKSALATGTCNTLHGLATLTTNNPCASIYLKDYNSSLTPYATISTPTHYSPMQTNTIMQNKVAVFHVIRDEDEKIIKTEFIKELWVETKNGQSVDFQVARDKDLAEYEISDLVIKTLLSVSF